MTDRTGRDVTDAEVTLLEVAPPDAAVLDNPGWHALRGADRGLAVPGPPGGGEPARDGRAARYRPEVSPFAAVADERDPAAWADLASLAGAVAPETIAFGGYRGYRAGGALVCMAGERLHPGEWTEVSAVCTAPAHQGCGLAGAIVSSLVTDICAAGRRPFLHVTVTNPARRLYERLGFTEHARVVVRVLRPPAA